MKKQLLLISLFVASTVLLVGEDRTDTDGRRVTTSDDRQALKAPTAQTRVNEVASDHLPVDVGAASDFDPIEVTWRRSPRSEFLYPFGSPLENYQYYRAMADAGNGLAAYKLYEMMHQCRNAFLTEEELNTAVLMMKQSLAFVHPKLKKRVYISEQDRVDDYIQSQERHFKDCKRFSQQQREQDEEWLELAANLGDTGAMIEYGRMLDDPIQFMVLAHSAWLAGESGGLIGLSESHERLYQSGNDNTSNVHAYVAMHAYVTVIRPVFGSDADTAMGSYTAEYERRLAQLAKSLSQDELHEAPSLAAELIGSNVNCCYHPLHLR